MGDSSMQDELATIDTSPLDKLTGLKAEIEVLDQRLATMEQRKEQVAETVYRRVRSDYETRRRALEQESAPLKAAAREQFVKLYALLSRSEADHEAARLDREEVDFRHALGEFDDAEYQKRIDAIDAQLQARSTAREQAQAMRARFVAAFSSEEELRPDKAVTAITPPSNTVLATTLPPPPMPAASAVQTVRMQPLSVPPPAVPPPAALADPGATQTMRALKGDAGAAPRADQTVVIRGARLVPQNPEAGKITHTVGLKPVMLGSAEQCDVRIPGSMPHHAEIRVSMSGYTISDLGGGVRVNGVAIEQHLLRHDEVLEIGPARFAFREG